MGILFLSTSRPNVQLYSVLMTSAKLHHLLTYFKKHLIDCYPGTRSSSTARRAMWVAAFWIVDDKLKLEQKRLYNTHTHTHIHTHTHLDHSVAR